MKTAKFKHYTVASVYDQHVRSWVTQLLDANNSQIGEAVRSSCRDDAKLVHRQTIADVSIHEARIEMASPGQTVFMEFNGTSIEHTAPKKVLA